VPTFIGRTNYQLRPKTHCGRTETANLSTRNHVRELMDVDISETSKIHRCFFVAPGILIWINSHFSLVIRLPTGNDYWGLVAGYAGISLARTIRVILK
jgi:hypothetical protein